MATSAGAFFAGIGTTFVILAVGFWGGLLTAKSALNEPSGFKHSARETPAPVRVVLLTSAEAAQRPPELPQQHASPREPVIQPASEPAKQVQVVVDKQAEKAETRKAEAEARDRKRPYAERKAKREAEARARQDQQRSRDRDAPVIAFGDGSSQTGSGLFGN